MKKITKTNPPVTLQTFASQENATFENLPGEIKNELRTAILRLQGYICCYCTNRVHDDSQFSKIEHFKAQSTYPGSQLDWDNLFVSCLGGEGQNQGFHCDKSKGKLELKFSPAQVREADFNYLSDGSISHIDQEFSKQINEVLNLNSERLKRNRLTVLNESINYMFKQKSKGTWSQSFINDMISEFEKRNSVGQHKPYFPIVVSYLRKKL